MLINLPVMYAYFENKSSTYSEYIIEFYIEFSQVQRSFSIKKIKLEMLDKVWDNIWYF